MKSCVDTVDKFIKSEGINTTSYERIVRANIPTIQGLARYMDVPSSTLRKWISTYPEFAEKIEMLNDEQFVRILNSGLSSDYSAVISRQALSSLHGLRDSTDITTNNKDLNISVVNYSTPKTEE